MKIGEVAASAGVTSQTIRYYESVGVLPEPARAPNGYRAYDDSTIKRLAFIRDAQTSGLELAEIQMILDMKDRGESTCGHVIAMLEGHLSDVDRQMGDLERTKERLMEMITRAKSLDPTACNDPNRCQTITSRNEPQ